MAEENVVRTNIVATSDMSSLIGDLNKVSLALSQLQERLSATNKNLALQAAVMNKAFAETLRSTGQFSTHFVSLTSDVDKFGQQLDKGQLKLGQFFRVYGEHVKTSGGVVRELAKQQVMLQNAVLQPLGRNAEGLMQYNVHIPRGLDLVKNKTAIARQELAIMNRVVQEGAGQLINWGKNTQWAGRQLTVGLTIPLAAFGKAAADAFRMADQELVRLTKVYGGLSATTSTELAKVRRDVSATASELARGYGASFKETISLAADIAATGKQGNELLGSVKETTRLAVLGEVDRQEAMKATLAIQTAFKQNTEELSDSINFLNAVENQTSTTLQDLVEAIPKAGPIIKGLGGSVQDLALYMTAMKEGGIAAGEGANALKSALGALINPTKVATAMFAGFGIDLKGIVQKNAGDVTATILELQAALDTLDPLQKQQALEQLFGKFQFARMNALFSNLGKQGSQTLQVMDLMKASSQDLANVASRELAQVTESASGRYRRALEGLKADLAGVGEQFLKINTALINIISNIVKFAGDLPGPIKAALSFFGMLTAVAGPLIMLTGVLGNFFGYIIKGVFHFKALFKGAEGWKLLTPEILAANKAGSMAEQVFYSDAKAAAILNQALQALVSSYERLEAHAAGKPIIAVPAQGMGLERQVNVASPYLTPMDTRDFAHMNPVGMMTEKEKAEQTMFGVVPGPKTVNRRISKAPQVYMEEDLPRVQGVTAAGKVSTGVVAGEAARFHAMNAALGMLTGPEVANLKKEVARTGLITDELAQAYELLLPTMQEITRNAAERSKQIVLELKENKITADQARARIIALNREIELMMATAAQEAAAGMGRTIDVSRLPLVDQPAVDPKTGKSNMKELFRKQRGSRKLITGIARALGVKTYGAPYSIETTIPKKYNIGGIISGTRGNYGNVYSPGQHGAIVPGPNVNYDIIPANVPVGGFVLNQAASRANPELVSLATQGYNDGGQLTPAILTPGETVVDPETYMMNKEAFDTANATKMSLGGTISRTRENYGIKLDRIGLAQLARAFISNRSGLTVSEKNKIIEASNRLTGRKVRSWPQKVERAHMSSPLDVFVGGKPYSYHPGIMFIQGRKINQATKSSGRGATGKEVMDDFNKLLKQGIHPGSLLLNNANILGYDNATPAIIDAYKEIEEVLLSSKYRDVILGGRNGKITLESITGPILKKHLRKVRKAKDGRNFYNDIFYQGGIRGKSGKTEDVVDLLGYNMGGKIPGYFKGGLITALAKAAFYLPNKINQAISYRRAKVMAKRGLYHGSRDKQGEYLVGQETLGDVRSRDMYYGMGFYSTTNKREADLYASGYNISTSGDTYGSLNELIGIPRGKYLDLRKKRGLRSLKWQDYATYLALVASRDKSFRARNKELTSYLPSDLGDTLRKVGIKGTILDPVTMGSAKGYEAEWLAWANSTGVQTNQIMNRGGRIPGYNGGKRTGSRLGFNKGGKIPGYVRGGGIARFLGSNILQMAGIAGGSALGGMLAGGPGSFIGSMIGGSLFSGGMGFRGREPIPVGARLGTAVESLPKMQQSIFANTKFGETLAVNAVAGNKFTSSLAKMALGISRTNAALAVGTTALMTFYKIHKDRQESLRTEALGYGLTADAAQKAGLKYLDLNSKMKEGIANSKALAEKNKLIYASLTQSNTPLKISVEEYRKLKEEIKKTMPEFIKLVDQTKRTEIGDLAVRLKAQFIAAGDSVENATKKVYALIEASNKKGLGFGAVSGQAFAEIQTPQDAAVAMVKAFSTAKTVQSQAAAVTGSLQAIDTAINKIIADSEKKAKKDKTNNTEVISYNNAQLQQLDLINTKVKEQKTFTTGVINEIKKQNPELGNVLNTTDNIQSAWAKYRITLQGTSLDLSKISGDAAIALNKMNEAINAAVEKEFKGGALSNKYSQLEKLRNAQSSAEKAAKGQSVQSQINSRKEIEALNKKIDAINKEADARKKALQEQQQDEDIITQIKKKQIEYQDALTSGNMSAAAQAQLDIQALSGQQQRMLGERAIEEKRIKDVTPLQERINAINEANQKAADAAALAGNNMNKLSDDITKLDNTINAVEESYAKIQRGLAEQGPNYLGMQDDLAALYDSLKKAGLTGGLRTTYQTSPEMVAGKPVFTNKEFTPAQMAQQFISTMEKLNQEIKTNSVVVNAQNLLGIGGAKTSGLTVNTGKDNLGRSVNMLNAADLRKAGISSEAGSRFIDAQGTMWEVSTTYYGQAYVGKVNQPKKREMGGPVMANMPYIVGEKRPELFIPKMDGTIIPNIPKFLNGILSVPYDMQAILHKGERVLSPSQARTMSTDSSYTISVGNVTMNFAEAPANGKELFAQFKEMLNLENIKAGGRGRLIQ